MSNLIVVNNPRDWPLDIPGATVMSARTYLSDPAYGSDHTTRVFNLCKSYRYQSLGYYVSLLAEARGHKPLRRAAAEGLVVIDDPDSILKCNNKVYLAEILARYRIPAPRTLLVHRDNVNQIIPTLALPCVLKQPDSSFSIGVVKVETAEELPAKVNSLLDKSELIVAQEYLPTEFDWRIGIIDRRPLFVAKYYMAPGHWQIIRHGNDKYDFVEGDVEALSVGEAPDRVVKMALKAANLIGDGFYGVDIKQVGKRLYIIEINDNPNVDAGNEDSVLKNALYREVMGVFHKRIEARKRGAG